MLWFGVVGAANGVSVMRDEETHSLWDPMTGKSFRGELKGTKLQLWPVFITSAGAELSAHKDTRLYISTHKSFIKTGFGKFFNLIFKLNKRGLIPPHFFLTLSRPFDKRLPRLTQGLGVIQNDSAKYYPLSLLPPGAEITDVVEGRKIRISRTDETAFPIARWADTEELPMQLMSRWYGFAYTYPNCAIFGPKK